MVCFPLCRLRKRHRPSSNCLPPTTICGGYLPICWANEVLTRMCCMLSFTRRWFTNPHRTTTWCSLALINTASLVTQISGEPVLRPPTKAMLWEVYQSTVFTGMVGVTASICSRPPSICSHSSLWTRTAGTITAMRRLVLFQTRCSFNVYKIIRTLRMCPFALTAMRRANLPRKELLLSSLCKA